MAKKRNASKAQQSKASAKPRGVNKSAFVRELPSTLSAAEVVAAAAEKGIKLSTAQVYTIRGNAKRADTKSRRGAAKAARASESPSASASAATSTSNRSEFIRSLPADLPAAEVVARAKAAGLTISAGLVYAVRSSSRKGAGSRLKGVSSAVPQSSLEKQFVSLALDLGLANAEALLARVRARLRDL